MFNFVVGPLPCSGNVISKNSRNCDIGHNKNDDEKSKEKLVSNLKPVDDFFGNKMEEKNL